MAIARREWLVLAGMLGVAGAGSAALRLFRPVGREIGESPVTRAVFAQPSPIGGNARGGLQLALFTDFNCSACRAGYADMEEAIAADGDVRLHYLNWPIFGDDSHDAARVALAADRQGLYAAVHGLLMRGPRATAQTARQAVATAGGNLGQLDQALATHGAEMDAALARNAFHAFSLGLAGTPSALAGPMLAEGALSTREWRRLFGAARG